MTDHNYPAARLYGTFRGGRRTHTSGRREGRDPEDASKCRGHSHHRGGCGPPRTPTVRGVAGPAGGGAGPGSPRVTAPRDRAVPRSGGPAVIPRIEIRMQGTVAS